ncbi:MAG TPA: hypothetical protein PJ997_01095 [Candidatus Paceibacterota bacterium]|nr:hypothetical protein [Candidatus Paceibacterota bacterium]HMP18919.1 hypothetical protein [Candidatus Paceibacterota bacterium]
MINFIKENIFFIIIALFILVSVSFSYYRYVVLEDFEYFLTEEEIPEQFNINSYI